ncbi:branched-chain alpha-keto acid dehydrogenase subunit E2 [Chlorella sorokiniana]|uniref:Branched-chain alpha-keto acid dehydrogenase subunit E2 n=1 Tax=Chlorella sorokiniana TaxID=3076 RepID=A0A2P6TU48_CHLSO|nr:branched-chain alpha-keto acid dehydrogenase subunit E2 [Chlorella sorokiniana]|eukprot:PRW57590.1 branched-chain alpha-keto acid dehydrogenase subunit E2 [Chlorella sorokiniana]
MWSLFSQPHLQRLHAMQLRTEAAQQAGEPPTPPPAPSDTAGSGRVSAFSQKAAGGSKGSAAAADGPPSTSGGGGPHALPRLQAPKLHHLDDEWDPIQGAIDESPRAALADQFSAMCADSSTLSRQQTSGPAYLEFPLFY